jgi:glycosyltransferase involved in cell wall biosynthesis
MKLLDICSSIPSRGIHYYAALISIGLNKENVKVKIVSSPGEADFGIRNRLQEENIEVIDFPESEKKGIINTIKISRFLRKIIKEYEPDIIHTWGLQHTFRFWLAVKFIGGKNIPIVTTLSSIRHGKKEEWLARIIVAQILNIIPGKLCVQCTSEKTKMLKAGIRKNKISVIPLVVDENLSSSNLDVKTKHFKKVFNLKIGIVYAAQFIDRKGHKFLIKAAIEVVKKHPECFFILPGTGKKLEYLKILTQQYGLSKYICYPGQISVADMPALINSAHFGVVASLSETFGSVIVEPLLYERPVVTTNVGIASDIAAIQGVTMIPIMDSKALAEALLYYIENPNVAIDDAKRGKEYILSNCKLNIVSQRYLKVFDDCLL